MSFSNEFLWGVATSAFQYEGAYLEDGKGWTVADERCKKKNKIQADSYCCYFCHHFYYLYQ